MLKTKNKLAGAIFLIGLWAGLHIFIPLIIPNPFGVMKVFVSEFTSGQLLLHIGHSTLRILGGIFFAVLVGYPAGLAAGLSNKTNSALSSVVYYLHPIPKIAFLPVFMVAFGLGDGSKMTLIFSILVFQIFLFIRDGVKEIEPTYFKVAKTMHFTAYKTFSKLIFPSTLPRLFSALRISMGISISVLFFAENYATTYGIGYFIMNSWSMVNYENMFAGILAIAILGMFLYGSLDWLERRLCKWLFLD